MLQPEARQLSTRQLHAPSGGAGRGCCLGMLPAGRLGQGYMSPGAAHGSVRARLKHVCKREPHLRLLLCLRALGARQPQRQPQRLQLPLGGIHKASSLLQRLPELPCSALPLCQRSRLGLQLCLLGCDLLRPLRQLRLQAVQLGAVPLGSCPVRRLCHLRLLLRGLQLCCERLALARKPLNLLDGPPQALLQPVLLLLQR